MPVCHPAEHACSTGSWRHSLGACSFDDSYTRTQGVVCHCGTCQNTSKPLPAHVLLVPETHRGERFKEQGNQAWPGLATEPCRLHPFTSLAILVPCPWPCLACLHCTATSALLEIAAPAAESKAGQSSTIKEKDQRGARQHSLQKIDAAAMRAPKPQPARSEAVLHWDSLLSQNCKKKYFALN